MKVIIDDINKTDENIFYLYFKLKRVKNDNKEIHIRFCSSFKKVIQNESNYTIIFADKFETSIDKLDDTLNNDTFSAKTLQNNIDGRFIAINITNNVVKICSDKLGRIDLFYTRTENDYCFSTVITDLAPNQYDDDLSILSFFRLYGSRSPRKSTLFKDIKRLGVNEVIKINKKFTLELNNVLMKKFKKHNQNIYNKLFLKSLEKRGNKDLNVVYLSSGWDSASILAGLKYIYGPQSVKAVTSRACNSKKAGVHNQYEVNRAIKIAEALGVKHYIVDTDYSKLSLNDIENWLHFTKKYGLYGTTAMSQYQIANYVSNYFGRGTTAFSGENSDGLHNLGFSQYVSIYHKYSRDFREYFDKIRSYLYGPTFFKAVNEGYIYEDPAYKIVRIFAGEKNFKISDTNANSIIKEFLKSLFLNSNRIPFYKENENNLITYEGSKYYFEMMYNAYLKPYESDFDINNPYDTYLKLYPSFHWQSSNVACVEQAGSENGIYNKLPFQDFELISYVTSSPESFGKGLELRPVKYPLKRFLEEKMKFPMEIGLGPHSYIYDTQPDFNILGEYIFRSNLTPYFKNTIEKHNIYDKIFINYFNKEIFNSYIHKYKNSRINDDINLTDVSKIIELSFHNPI